ncbi:EAL domain-containing protein [Rhizobium sp. B230/85]|nr:EAL domain-containing protein [Rhizobium sp. L58/93]MBO9132651.1 EAL domain-containing protein [Rhizobium sp. B209b/85]MBO9168809.1 EAL domain-containing protein [Rhizobium sp. L245/93]MBO9184759.1 EAL domain-containing protein [Rhizobium sp. E27B/91]QXZ85773.1 EAL domain-containing protein [Rhizobium sp. K1/93]QXZ91800.1 EAL domain-containing protein [Rhizobium sp. K15/93]QXZ97848.1 EAL domain-containing protein [Rhizobium sp. B230/85]QYA03389.1 EAL domain-containing protein [Rhizobium s
MRLRGNSDRPIWVSASFTKLATPENCILIQLADIDREKRLIEDLGEKESRWNSALTGSGLGVWDHDFVKGRLSYSETWRKMRGYTSEEEVDAALENWILSVHPDDRDYVLKSIELQNSGKAVSGTFCYRERHKDGHWIWIECRGAGVEWDEHGTPTRIIGTDIDITARKAAEELLTHTSRRLDLALDVSGIGVFEANLDTGVVEWDHRLLVIYGLQHTPSLKRLDAWIETIHPDDRERIERHLQDHLAAREAFEQEYRIVRPDGTVRVIRGRSTTFVDGSGTNRMIGANWDVTTEVGLRDELNRAKELAEARNIELELAKEKIEHIALHDHLTGLPNRRYLDRVLSARAEECRAQGMVLVVLHVDLDRFKQINDTLGHRAGDMMLKHAASVLRDGVAAGDFVARIGGDEFVIVCTRKAYSRKISGLAEQVIRELHKPVRYEGHDIRFGASIGIAFDSGDDLDAKQLLLNADIALYRAKGSGRNRHEFFSLDARQHIVTTKRLSDEILLGIERHEFIPFYQPQFSAATLDVIGVETLVRWDHPEHGILSPDSFMSTAEDLDVVAVLDRLVLEKALADQQSWRDAGIDIPKISVNVSARRLADPNLGKALRALKIKPGTVSFELLESISLDQYGETSLANLKRLRRFGIDIEIDDFGTGHASIVGLLRLSPKTLKIDRELIKPLVASAEQRRLVGSIIEIGRSQKIGVTAEGVETMEHARILAELGCDSLQGYALARPMPAAEIPAFIRSECWRPDRNVQAA